MMSHVTGKTVLITGASRGIGEASARLFAQHGANVVLLARSEAQIASIAADIGDTALAVKCDVSVYGDVERAVEQACDAFNSVDILINNAGVIDPNDCSEVWHDYHGEFRRGAQSN